MKDEKFVKVDNTHYIDTEVDHELRTSFINYAMAVNVSRAIPDVRDGLKPVHRRILYCMAEENLFSDKPFKKCATTVGDVLGHYHPHGDASVYDALVRLAQDFSINEPLIDGHGNFGSVDGDDAAAYRYTESRLSKISNELLRDIDKNTVDFVPNFDGQHMEPTVLPSRFPNLLVNGSDGIAVGMATNIPPHNLGEVIDAVVAMIDNPDISIDEIIRILPAPDFPTGGILMGKSAINEAYRTGRGGYVIRAKTEIEEFDDGKRYRIVATEIPYQVNKARLITQIADLVKDKRIEGISNINDESDREGMRIVIELKRDANPQVVLNTLFKMSQLQTSNGIIMLALDDGQPKVMPITDILRAYIKFQEQVIERRTRFDLEKAEEKAHILEGLVIAVQNIDDVVHTIKISADRNDAMNRLMTEFNLSDKQANAILDMRLSKLTGLEVEKLTEELDELDKQIAEFKDILSSEGKILQIVRKEILEIKENYATPRKTEISLDYDDIDIGDLIEKHEVVISMTAQGYIKRMPLAEYRSQNRGGRGVSSHKTKEEDAVIDLFSCNSHDNLLFFTNKGKVYDLKAYLIPEANRQAKGRAMVNLLQLEPDEKVSAVIRRPEGEGCLVMATSFGYVKKTNLSEFDSIRKNGKLAVKLNEGDYLVSVKLSTGDDDIMVASDNGRCLRCNERDIKEVGRNSQGIKCIKLDDDEHIIDMMVIKDGMDILTVTEKAFAKRTDASEYRTQARGGKGIKAGTFNAKTGLAVAIRPVDEDKDVLLITNTGVTIRVHAVDCNKVGRGGQGVRIMRLGDEGKVVSVAVVDHEDDEPSETVEQSVDTAVTNPQESHNDVDNVVTDDNE